MLQHIAPSEARDIRRPEQLYSNTYSAHTFIRSNPDPTESSMTTVRECLKTRREKQFARLFSIVRFGNFVINRFRSAIVSAYEPAEFQCDETHTTRKRAYLQGFSRSLKRDLRQTMRRVESRTMSFVRFFLESQKAKSWDCLTSCVTN